MDRAPTDDWSLLSEWRDGDPQAGKQLAARYFDLLLRFFINKVRELDDATDLVSETLLGCLANGGQIENPSAFRSYVFATAMNQLRKYYRKQAKRQRELDDFADICVNSSWSSSPSSVVAHAQEVQLLANALRRLTLAQQIVIELRYFEGLERPEIAECLGIPASTVSTHLHRGRARLATIIRELADSPKLAASTLIGIDTWAGQIRSSVGRE